MSTQISISPVIKLEVNTTPITGGSAGQILFQTTGNTVGESANLFWDATNNRLGIGTSSPSAIIHSVGSVTASGAIARGNYLQPTLVAAANNDNLVGLDITPTFNVGAFTGVQQIGLRVNTGFAHLGTQTNPTNTTLWNTALHLSNTTDAALLFRTGATFNLSTGIGQTSTGNLYIGWRNAGNPPINIFYSTGNVGINTTTDAGFKLDVNGTARVQNTTTITKGASNYITFEPSANGTSPFLDMFFSGQVSTRISLGTTSSTRVFLFRDLGTALGMGIDCGAIFSNSNAILIGGAEQKVQIAGTTNNYLQFTQAGTANRGTIGYAAGQSYMQIRVNGATDLATGTFSTAFFSTGNIGINTTTDAGFRLDVNGTARVTGAMTIGNSVITGNFGNLTLSNNGIAGVVLTFSNNRWGTSDLAVFGTQGAHADASSQIEIRSTTRGFLPPRMTTAQKNAIASPATGLMVYDTDLNRPCFYNGSSWITL